MVDRAKNIAASTFEIQKGRYVYAKVSEVPSLSNHFLMTRDAHEITVVTREENLDSLKIIERNKESYTLIALNVSMPFYPSVSSLP